MPNVCDLDACSIVGGPLGLEVGLKTQCTSSNGTEYAACALGSVRALRALRVIDATFSEEYSTVGIAVLDGGEASDGAFMSAIGSLDLTGLVCRLLGVVLVPSSTNSAHVRAWLPLACITVWNALMAVACSVKSASAFGPVKILRTVSNSGGCLHEGHA